MKKNLLLLFACFITLFANAQTFTLSSTVLCTGPSTTFVYAGVTVSVSGATSYSWTTLSTSSFSNNTYASNLIMDGSQVMIAYLYPGTTTIVCSAYSGSTFLSSSSNTVLVYASPLFSMLSSNPSNVCSGSTVTLGVTGSTNYTWFPSGVNSSSIVITPTANVTYTVASSNTNCTFTDTIHIAVSTGPPSLTFSPGATFLLCSTSTGSYGDVFVSGAVSYTWSSPYTWNNGFTGAQLPVTALGCYTVTGTTACGSTTAAACATGALPPPSLYVTGPATLCAGASATLFANGTNGPNTYPTYYWYASNPNNNAISQTTTAVISPTASTCYTLYGQNTACSNQTVFCVTLATQTLTVSPSFQTVCEGTSATFSASGASTYTWSSGATTSTMNVLPASSTTYTVSGTFPNGCVSADFATVTVDTTCADVWPGDANSDGLVDNTDVFEIGLAYSNTGPSRTPGGNSFIAQYAGNWAGTVSTSKNQNHADCNGDGTIDMNDTLAIYLNYSLTHSFKPAQTSSNPDIYLYSADNLGVPAVWNSVDIILGDASTPMSQLYGVAFDINFDKDLIETNSAYIHYTSSFLNASNTNVEFKKQAFSDGKIYAASVRTNGSNVSGAGKIGEFWYKFKDDVAFNSQLILSTSNATRIDNAGASSSLNGGSTSIAVLISGIKERSNFSDAVRLYPNPASDKITITSSQAEKAEYTVRDISGREVLKGEFKGSGILDVSLLSSGSYIVQVRSGASNAYKKFVKH